MKILCVIDSLGSGGAQRQLVNLAIGFKERRHNVSFLVYHHSDFYLEELKHNNISVHEIIERNYFMRIIKMRSFIRRGRFDTVLSFLEAANFICELAGLPWRKWKLVVGERSSNPAILKSFKLRLYRWFHLFADHIVANSYENQRLVRKINPLIPLNKCHVIYNTVDVDKWAPNVNYKPKKDGKFRLVIASSHQYLKNLNGLIEAVNLLSDKEKELIFVDWYGDNIAGNYFDQSYPQAVEKLKKYNLTNQFRFFPATHQIHKIVKESDSLGLFSLYEGLPNSVCEAMVAGKPVIVSRVSDISRFIKDLSLICNPHNPISMKSSLSYLLSCNDNTLKEIGNQNHLTAYSLFNRTKIISQYLDLMI